MSLKAKILAQLKVKYPGVNLSNVRLNAIADKLDLMITDENEIDAQLDSMNSFHSFADIAKQDDQVRALQAKLGGPKPQPQPKPANDPNNNPEPADDEVVPKWAQGLIQTVSKLSAEKTQTTMMTRLAAKLKDKVPASYYAKRNDIPEKEEDLDAFIETVTADYTAFTQDLVNTGLAVTTVPADSAEKGKVGAKAVLGDIEAWAKKSQPEVKKEAVQVTA